MITLIRRREDCKSDDLQAALEQLVVAHRVEIVCGAADAAGKATALPAIVEGERTISGDDALRAYMHELTEWMGEWRKYQADACYIAADGETC